MKFLAYGLGIITVGYAITAAIYAAAPFVAVGAIIYGIYRCSSDKPVKA